MVNFLTVVEITQESYDFSRGRFKKDNTPYQRYIKAGYFSVREQVIQTGDTVPVTYISGRGLDYIRKRLKKANANI